MCLGQRQNLIKSNWLKRNTRPQNVLFISKWSRDLGVRLATCSTEVGVGVGVGAGVGVDVGMCVRMYVTL